MTGVIGIIQARLRSSRLPGKILAPIAGRPLLAVLIERLRSARVEEWWLATTDGLDDDVTAAWGDALGVRVHRGSVDDVLSRYTAIIRERGPRWIVRVTADDPFMDGAFINALLEGLDVLEKAANSKPPLSEASATASPLSTSSLVPPAPVVPPLIEIGGPLPVFPLGYAPQLARAEDVVASEATIPEDQPFHRSHVLSWLRANAKPHTLRAPASWPKRPDWRWTVDTLRDLEMTHDAFALFGDAWRDISYVDMVAALDTRPDITDHNRDVRQKALHEG